METHTRSSLLLFAVILLLTLVGFVAGLLVLPDTLVMQITSDGSQGTTLPRLPALILLSLMTIGGAVRCLVSGTSGRVRHNGLLLSAVGLLLFILTFVFNL